MAWKSLETTDSLTFRASILDFKARLANRCKLFPVYTLFRASILDFKARLENRCSTIVVAVENGPPAAFVAATMSAADSNFCCCDGRLRPILIFVASKKNGTAAAVAATMSAADSNFCCCDGRLRPILIFFAAKKVVPPAASVATIIFHVRFNSSMRQRKMVPPADRSNTELQRFLISGGQFGNRCRECPEIAPPLQRFLISWGKLGNRCKETL